MFFHWQLTGFPNRNWVSAGASSTSVATRKQCVDAEGNIYAFINSTLTKFSPSGIPMWQRTYSSYGFNSLDIDSQGYLYATGEVSNSTLLVKFSPTGSVEWNKTLHTTSGFDSTSTLAVDASDNIYIVGYAGSISNQNAIIAKYNSSGTLQWQRTLSGSLNDNATDVITDSVGDVYIAAYSIVTQSPAVTKAIIAKYNSSGTLQWQRSITNSGNELDAGSITIDSSDNIYVAGQTAQNADCFVAKYNSSGTIQWQYKYSTTASSSYGYAVLMNEHNGANELLLITRAGNTSGDGIIIGINPSTAAITWQENISSTNEVTLKQPIFTKDENSIVIPGSDVNATSGVGKALLIKIDSAITQTGSYGGYTFTHPTTTFTASSTSYTEAAGGLTAATSSLTDSSTTVTEATLVSYSPTITYLP